MHVDILFFLQSVNKKQNKQNKSGMDLLDT